MPEPLLFGLGSLQMFSNLKLSTAFLKCRAQSATYHRVIHCSSNESISYNKFCMDVFRGLPGSNPQKWIGSCYKSLAMYKYMPKVNEKPSKSQTPKKVSTYVPKLHQKQW